MLKSFEISFRDNYSVAVKDFTLKSRPPEVDNISPYFKLATKKVRFSNILQEGKLYCCCIEEAEHGSHTVTGVFSDDNKRIVATNNNTEYIFRNSKSRLAKETANRFMFNINQLDCTAEFVTFVYEFKNCVKPPSPPDFVSKYSKYFAKKENLDITFVADEKEIKANKHHLMVMSHVFEAMFNDSWKEDTKICIKDTTAKAFQMFINLIHGIENNTSFDVQTELEIIMLADRYDVLDIGHNVALDVVTRVTKFNVINVLNVGFLSNCNELKEAAIDCLKQKPVEELRDIPDYNLITPEMMEYICGKIYQMLPAQ